MIYLHVFKYIYIKLFRNKFQVLKPSICLNYKCRNKDIWNKKWTYEGTLVIKIFWFTFLSKFGVMKMKYRNMVGMYSQANFNLLIDFTSNYIKCRYFHKMVKFPDFTEHNILLNSEKMNIILHCACFLKMYSLFSLLFIDILLINWL